MRTYDLSPLYRSTVGFDRIANLLDAALTGDNQPSYPPYNIEKTGEDAYRITLAVAGFSEDELSIEAREGQLVISGKKAAEEGEASAATCIAASPPARSSAASSWRTTSAQMGAVAEERPAACGSGPRSTRST